MAKKYQAPIVRKAFNILDAISKSRKGMRLSEISAALNISKSTVHGIIAALEDQGAIIRDVVTKRYTIGLTLIELGKAAYGRINLKDTARPFLEALMAHCQESVFLGVRNGNSVTVIDIIEAQKDFKISSPIGTSLPLLTGAVGKIFLSQLSYEKVQQYLHATPLIRYTANTITDADHYQRELESVIKKGYATDDEEYLSGVRAVAAPVKPFAGYLSAIWVVGFTASMTAGKLDSIIEQTCLTAEKLSNRLKERL